MRIALDAMGGDLAPKAALEGAVAAARELRIELILVGNREVIARELADYDTRGLPITIEHAPEAVAMDDSPLESVLGKPDSSIHLGLDLVRLGKADGFVSAGNSGAVMAAAMAILGNLPRVDRPAIASVVPTTAGVALLIDAGANTEVKSLNLVQFAVMGSVYWRHVREVPRPRVGILSNGEESSKGTDLTRSAASALLQMAAHINYVGYIEGRDINRAKADVVVTDGFTGNVTLKTMEGFASFLLGNLREVFGSGMLRRIAYLLVRRKLGVIRERLDPAEYGGAPLLGVNGVVIVAHGSSNSRAVRNAIRAAANEALVRHVNAEIVEVLAATPPTIASKPSSVKGIRGIFERMRDRLYHGRDNHVGWRSEPFPERRRESAERSDRSEKTEKAEKLPRIEPPERADATEPRANVRGGREDSPIAAETASGVPLNLAEPRADAPANVRKAQIEKSTTANGSTPAPGAGNDTVEAADEQSPPAPDKAH
ncbi:MAG TPA: phosphate acyltransferase PlsX [Candidatus Binataceae bacterium]|nr:phosphate acyltransferase PlsX [Candidatus Binataceae bacterium]